MKHVGAIASRDLRSLFVSPVAYVVLTLWAVLAATFFLASLIGFQEQLIRAQQFQAFDHLESMNLNDDLIAPFYLAMWLLLLFLLPAVTMGLFTQEKANGTEELLLTSPVTIWEIVLGKFGAGAVFAAIMMALVAFYPGILFVYGDPDVGTTLSGLLGLYLVSLAYVAVGAFASSLTRNQLVAWILTVVLLLVLGWMLPVIVEIGVARDPLGGTSDALVAVARYIGTGEHFERMLDGAVHTMDLAYFGVVIGIFLLLTKASVESVRWR